jgi:hypothetical protein
MVETITFMSSPMITAVDVKYWLSDGMERVYPAHPQATRDHVKLHVRGARRPTNGRRPLSRPDHLRMIRTAPVFWTVSAMRLMYLSGIPPIVSSILSPIPINGLDDEGVLVIAERRPLTVATVCCKLNFAFKVAFQPRCAK